MARRTATSRSIHQHGGARPGAGRPRKPANKRREYIVVVRLTRGEYAKLRSTAQAEGLPLAVLVRERASHSTK